MASIISSSIQIPQHPFSKLGRTLESKVRKALYDFKLVPENGKIAVALSGGKDSLTLLFLLKIISGKGFLPFELIALHVGGEFTCGAGVTEQFLSQVCAAIDVPLYVAQSTQKLETLACYSCSRERRSLLFSLAKEHGAHTVAFGHTKDDNAETLLMNLVQKGEFCGMLPKLPMVHYGVTIIRPLIFIDEEEIKTFAKQHNYLRITCRCPVGATSQRKEAKQILESFRTLSANAKDNLSRASLYYGSTKAIKEPL